MTDKFNVPHESFSTGEKKLAYMKCIIGEKQPIRYYHREDVLENREPLRDIISDISNCKTESGKKALIATAYNILDDILWNAAFVDFEKE